MNLVFLEQSGALCYRFKDDKTLRASIIIFDVKPASNPRGPMPLLRLTPADPCDLDKNYTNWECNATNTSPEIQLNLVLQSQ